MKDRARCYFVWLAGPWLIPLVFGELSGSMGDGNPFICLAHSDTATSNGYIIMLPPALVDVSRNWNVGAICDNAIKRCSNATDKYASFVLVYVGGDVFELVPSRRLICTSKCRRPLMARFVDALTVHSSNTSLACSSSYTATPNIHSRASASASVTVDIVQRMYERHGHPAAAAANVAAGSTISPPARCKRCNAGIFNLGRQIERDSSRTVKSRS